MKRMGHQDYIERLNNMVKGMYDYTEKNVKYKKGELDLVGHKGHEIDIYEVKSSDRFRNKAIEQLNRARSKLKSVRCTLYYNGRMNKIELI
jgi:Holliday junction resolvase-like predicted endonuclease